MLFATTYFSVVWVYKNITKGWGYGMKNDTILLFIILTFLLSSCNEGKKFQNNTDVSDSISNKDSTLQAPTNSPNKANAISWIFIIFLRKSTKKTQLYINMG